MKIQFLGGAGTVTGSMYLVTVNGKRLLLECGLFQGHRQEAETRNRNLPFDPRTVDAMVLSHAHIDHSGNIPTLVREGFAGRIHCTSATRDLCAIMLPDSAHVQLKDIEFLNKRRLQAGEEPKTPLYTVEEADRSLRSFVAHNYEETFQLWEGLKATLYDAGHILGSSLVLLETEGGGQAIRYLFTGDLGRKHLPILRDPTVVKDVDFLQIESTYGDRVHGPIEQTTRELMNAILETTRRPGKIIIPAFAVGRTQEIVYELHQLINEKKIPALPVFVDSPLSVNATEVFRRHPECFDEETLQLISRHDDPLGLTRLTYIESSEDSKKLNTIREPCVIISASGMCEGGRVLHHLIHSIEDARNIVLIVGFQAQGTLGKRLVDKEKTVRIYGQEFSVRARVLVLNGFSAHADRNDLLGYVAGLGHSLRGVFVVHGDPDQSEALAQGIRSWDPGVKIEVPTSGEEYTL